MKTIKGPGIFLAQFAGDAAPFNNSGEHGPLGRRLGFVGVQIPTWDKRLFDLKLAAESQDYCDQVLGTVRAAGIQITELSTHLQGQLSPATRRMTRCSKASRRRISMRRGRQQWAVQQLHWAARASQNLGLTAHATFSGALAWPYFYPWPQRPAGLVDETFNELARRWLPILNAFEEAGVDACFELHPGEDLHDGATFERFLAAVDNHPRANILYDPSHMVLQQMDYLAFLDLYHERVRAFHVKDAEFRPNGRSRRVWRLSGLDRSAGPVPLARRRAGGFQSIFSKMAQYDYPGWAVLEWECCIKHPEAGAAEGAPFIRDHIIRVTEKAFDDFAGGGTDHERNRKILGLA